MENSLKLLVLLLALGSQPALAGRPVYHELTRSELVERSDFVFSGWPSRDKPVTGCKEETGRWWVHKVYKGDKSLEGKVVALAVSNYQLFAAAKGGKLPSYAAYRYKEGTLNLEQSTSFLFTKRQKDGCFELVADGAQEHRFEEIQIEALFNPADCEAQLRAFGQKADAMPRDCKIDSDCRLFYVHPNSCGRPYLWSKATEVKFDADFLALQARARSACGKDWSKQPACEPDVYPFRCRANRCEEGFPEAAAKPKLAKAVMRAGCAPHDASSMMFQVTDGKSEYPVFTINWWKNRPEKEGGTFRVSGKGNMEEGFQSVFCLYKGGCKMLKNVEAKLLWPKGAAKGTLDFSFTTEDGDVFSGSVPVDLERSSGLVPCG